MSESVMTMSEENRENAVCRMESMVDLEAVRNIKDQLAVTMNGTVKGTMQNYMTVLREDLILSILVDTFISKISLPMQPVPEIGSISVA